MLVSSHLLAEIAQTVDDVVIIARGRLVVQSPLADPDAALAHRRARPDAAAGGAARSALADRGIAAERAGPDDARSRSETTPEAVGLAAAGAGVVLYEMTAEHVDLEDLFLELTTTMEVA